MAHTLGNSFSLHSLQSLLLSSTLSTESGILKVERPETRSAVRDRQRVHAPTAGETIGGSTEKSMDVG